MYLSVTSRRGAENNFLASGNPGGNGQHQYRRKQRSRSSGDIQSHLFYSNRFLPAGHPRPSLHFLALKALCRVESLNVLLCQSNSCFQVFTHQVFRFLLFLFRHSQRSQHHFIKFFFIIQYSTVSLRFHTVNNAPHRIKQILRIHHRTFQNLLPLEFIGITNQYHNDMFLKIYA